jgi:hypothetical protein
MTGKISARRSFAGGVAFAAIAALALPVSVLGLSPFVGYASALSLHLLASSVGYLVWLAPSRQHALGAAVLAGIGIPLLWCLWPGSARDALAWNAVACAVVVAMVRSLHSFRARPVRALALEGMLGSLGACLAMLLVGPTLLSQAAALWGYLLVQSLHALVPGVRVRWPGDGARDPFDRASARLRRLLDDV